MADLDVGAALIRKRAELADLIEHQQKKTRRLPEVRAHIEATVKLSSPDFELRTGARARPFRNRFFFSGQANASGWSWTSSVRRKAWR